MLKNLASYENPIFKRPSKEFPGFEEEAQFQSEEEFDEESFRSDLERDSSNRSSLQQRKSDTSPPNLRNYFTHEERHKLLLREGNRRASLGMATGGNPQEALKKWPEIVAAEQIDLRLLDQSQPPPLQSQQVQRQQHHVPSFGQPRGSRARSSLRMAMQQQRKREINIQYHQQSPTKSKKKRKRKHPVLDNPMYRKPERPPLKLSNLFGLIDTNKLKSSLGIIEHDQFENNEPMNPASRPYVVPDAPELQDRTDEADLSEAGSALEEQKLALQKIEFNRGRNDALFYGSICSFVAGVLLVMSFASPYWLVSWEDTQSPFKNMGLWEFCFYKFRHPDYQFDHLFHGCYALYGEEYRLIREKLLPGWLMVVQLFVTLALIFSFFGQMILVALVLRAPLEIILRFEYHFCAVTFFCNALSALLLFLSVLIFGICCWARDWLLYPNYNYPSWSFALAVFSSLIHIFAAIYMYQDARSAKERKERNKALIMQMHPPGFSNGSGYHMSGSNYI